MRTIKEILHEKRKATEDHIKQLQEQGKQGVRYTAMMSDIPFLILGLISDIGWMIHLVAGVLFVCGNGLHRLLDYMVLIALVAVLFGVGCLIYLNKIHEKEIATRLQKNLSFGMTVYAGLAGGIIGILRMVTDVGTSSALVWMVIGGFLNFASGLPIYLSFKKGIVYGVK
ncbi:MAG TPA: hypothetical protein DDW30_04895 [Clostridiales bacterium]|nr:hypothetical protein [Clostridiales bacterium]